MEYLGYLKQNFHSSSNITFDRYLFLTRKQQKGEPIEKFYGQHKELSENCDLGERGDTIIRDVFIANMQKKDIQKELLKEMVEPDKALAIAMNIEMGTLNQLKMNAIKSERNSTVNHVQRMGIANATPLSNMNTTARKKPTTCHFCGMNWTSEHRNKCPARGKKCNNCALKITSQRSAKNPRIQVHIQNPNHGSKLSKRMIRLMMSIKFRLILILIWNRRTIIVLHQYLQQILKLL